MDGLKAEFLARAEAAFPQDAKRMKAAVDIAERIHERKERASGENVLTHCLAVSRILLDMKLDADAVIAGILHDVFEESDITKADVEAEFGPSVALIVDGVTRISILKAQNKTIQQAETIRKMLFAMTEDLRVILVKLADKLHNMRTLSFLPEGDQKRIASECVEIFAPLAERLGMSWLKDELEDLSLKVLNRDAYDQIKGIVAAKKGERESYLSRVENAILAEAHKSGIATEVESRAKHFYSIYQKMKKRNKAFDEIYDLLGIRAFCGTREECYATLGIIHSLWKPMDGRFKDYIAFPKSNGYRSLHTTVMCYDGRLLEVQIRTRDMHEVAEFGIASHWIYKKGSANANAGQDSIAIINRLKTWQDMDLPSGEFLDEIKRELLKDSIFVFTPKGDAVELPAGSTPLDFAYHVHTAVGNACVGAKADGQIIPLSAELRNTQVIEIMTQSKAHPNINWLKIAKTNKAKSKIRQWLVANDHALAIEMNIIAKKKPDEKPDERTGHRDPERERTQALLDSEIIREVKEIRERGYENSLEGGKLGISIDGDRNMLIKLALCCRPVQGDAIIGYVSRGRGIIVHKATCTNLPGIPEFAERAIEVSWETDSARAVAHFRVVAKRSQDIFSEIEGAVRKFKGHLIEGKLEDTEGKRLSGTFTMEFDSGDDVKKAVKHIKSIPNIVSIQPIDRGH